VLISHIATMIWMHPATLWHIERLPKNLHVFDAGRACNTVVQIDVGVVGRNLGRRVLVRRVQGEEHERFVPVQGFANGDYELVRQ